jgi:hypothetical protein
VVHQNIMLLLSASERYGPPKPSTPHLLSRADCEHPHQRDVSEVFDLRWH